VRIRRDGKSLLLTVPEHFVAGVITLRRKPRS